MCICAQYVPVILSIWLLLMQNTTATKIRTAEDRQKKNSTAEGLNSESYQKRQETNCYIEAASREYGQLETKLSLNYQFQKVKSE